MVVTWLSAKNVSVDVLLSHLPAGKAWRGFRIAGQVAHRFIRGLARLHQDAWRFLNTVHEQIDYRTTTQLITEWEAGLSLPDRCLPRATTLEQRRRWIAFRLNKRRWNTARDWHDLAALFDLQIRITPGWVVQRPALYAAIYPVQYFQFPKLGRFRVYIDILNRDFGGYPYDGMGVPDDKYPIPYRSGFTGLDDFMCLIERVAPANVLVIWNDFPVVPPHGNMVTYSPDYSEEYS